MLQDSGYIDDLFFIIINIVLKSIYYVEIVNTFFVKDVMCVLHEVWIDASCKHEKISKNKYGKVGHSTIAFIVRVDGKLVFSSSSYVGILDNNQAEYEALIAAITYVVSHYIEQVIFYTDSNLLEKQMNNKYSCNSPLLHPYYSNAKKIIKMIKNYSIVWINRKQNKDADTLCNQEYEKTVNRSEDVNEKTD